MIRLLLADDQALVRGALAALLDLEPDLAVVAQVGRGDEVRRRRPGERRRRGAARRRDAGAGRHRGGRRAAGRAYPACRSLVVTTFGRPGYLRRALDAGASGFVVKDTPAEQLADAVRRVHRGLRVVDPDLAVESLAVGAQPADRARAGRPGRRGGRRDRRGHRPARRSCPRGRCATTCPPRWARQAPGRVPRRSGWRRRTAGCSAEGEWVHDHDDSCGSGAPRRRASAAAHRSADHRHAGRPGAHGRASPTPRSAACAASPAPACTSPRWSRPARWSSAARSRCGSSRTSPTSVRGPCRCTAWTPRRSVPRSGSSRARTAPTTSTSTSAARCPRSRAAAGERCCPGSGTCSGPSSRPPSTPRVPTASRSR